MRTRLREEMLVGNQILLREIQLSDANITYQNWMNDPLINRFLESRFQETTLDGLVSYVEQITNSPDHLFLAILDKQSKTHVGNIKLGPIHPIHRYADIGLLIGDSRFWGKGFATEAIQLLSKFSFEELHLHKLSCGIYATNPGSASAFQKAGFILEGTKKSKYLCDGVFVDAWEYGLLNPAET